MPSALLGRAIGGGAGLLAMGLVELGLGLVKTPFGKFEGVGERGDVAGAQRMMEAPDEAPSTKHERVRAGRVSICDQKYL
tara:strand:+ start:5826 stop:6065 length:240 start_codon:yes stop_codon:yes gene_type:complete